MTAIRVWLTGLGLLAGIASCTAILGSDFEIVPAGQGGSAGGGGGGPSVCGDGDLAGPETCDDGNDAAGDGCDADCLVEGSCDAPLPLAEVAADGSHIEYAVQSRTGGVDQVGLAACDGSPQGSGSDRIYTFTLTDARDVRIQLDADFDHLVRVLTSPCDPLTEVAAAGQSDGCTTSGELRFPALTPASYFVVVDGLTAADEGAFTLTVTASCPLSALRLGVLGIGTPDVIALDNLSESCAIDLSSLHVLFDDSSGADVHVDLEAQLALPNAPDALLAPGARRWLSDEPAPIAIETGEPVPFDSTRGGAVVVCRGPCGDSALNVVDVVAFSEGEDHPPLPNGATFSPLGLSGIVAAVDEPHLSYQRVATDAAAPEFLASDWTICFSPPTVFYDSFEDENYDGWTAVPGQVVYDVIGFSSPPHGSYAVRIQDNTGSYNGLSRSIEPSQPTRIQFSLRGSPAVNGFVGWFQVGDDNVSGEDGIAHFRIGGSDLIITRQGGSLVMSGYTTTDWNTVVYDNIDWQNKTFDLVINQQVVQAGAGFWQQDLAHITQVHLFNTADGYAQWDGIIMTE